MSSELEARLEESIAHYEEMRDTYENLRDKYDRWCDEKMWNHRMYQFVWLPLGVIAVFVATVFAVLLVAGIFGYKPLSHLKNENVNAIPAIKSKTMNTPNEAIVCECPCLNQKPCKNSLPKEITPFYLSHLGVRVETFNHYSTPFGGDFLIFNHSPRKENYHV
jgi:hypothetical protein